MRKSIEKQFLAAYEAYADAIFRYCFFKTKDQDLAKDLVQQTFLKAWVYLGQDHQIDNFRAFLYRLAGNLIIDWYRKRKAESLEKLADKGFEPADRHTSPDTQAEVAWMLKVLDTLDPADQELIIWRYVEDLSPRTIAEMLHEKENNVSVRIHRAKERLWKKFSPN
jgi:RNA polymerase sigma-70 factor (ECF subfamily)